MSRRDDSVTQSIFVTVCMWAHTEKAVDTHATFRLSIHRVDELSYLCTNIDPNAAPQGSLVQDSTDPQELNSKIFTNKCPSWRPLDTFGLIPTVWPELDLSMIWLLLPCLNLLWSDHAQTGHCRRSLAKLCSQVGLRSLLTQPVIHPG